MRGAWEERLKFERSSGGTSNSREEHERSEKENEKCLRSKLVDTKPRRVKTEEQIET